jgi:hypothetical protein
MSAEIRIDGSASSELDVSGRACSGSKWPVEGAVVVESEIDVSGDPGDPIVWTLSRQGSRAPLTSVLQGAGIRPTFYTDVCQWDSQLMAVDLPTWMSAVEHGAAA